MNHCWFYFLRILRIRPSLWERERWNFTDSAKNVGFYRIVLKGISDKHIWKLHKINHKLCLNNVQKMDGKSWWQSLNDLSSEFKEKVFNHSLDNEIMSRRLPWKCIVWLADHQRRGRSLLYCFLQIVGKYYCISNASGHPHFLTGFKGFALFLVPHDGKQIPEGRKLFPM